MRLSSPVYSFLHFMESCVLTYHGMRAAQIKSVILELDLFRSFVIALEYTPYKGMPLLYSHLYQRIQQ